MQSLVLAKNSTALHYFIQPPLNPQLKVHIFNYTNTERFLDGTDDKLIVEDIGPFVYTEKTTKVEVVYNNNNTISYRVNICCLFVSVPLFLRFSNIRITLESFCDNKEEIQSKLLLRFWF